MSDTAPVAARPSRLVGLLWWILAFLMAFAVLVYQRRTGPTYPLGVTYDLDGTTHSAQLVRSGITDGPARVEIPAYPEAWRATVHWRRYPTDDAYAPLTPESGEEGPCFELPVQPSAGKLTYFVEFRKAGTETTVRTPASAEADPVLRYKDPVPGWLVLVHVIVMILTFTFAMRALLAALFARPELARIAWLTLGLMALGGFVLGPLLQKYAFGEYWTGWPNGHDLTDNKALIAWLVWGAACVILWASKRRRPGLGRIAIVAAALVMLVVYLIPHSLRGSELDYERLEDGVTPQEAIKTG